MPRIPTYDTPQAEARALPGVRQSSAASPALFGAAAEQQIATGKSMLNAGTQLGDIANRMQDRENADSVFRVDGALKRDFIDYEQDVRKTRQGRFASGLVNDTEKWFDEQEKKHGAALTNEVQRQLFGQRLQSLRMSALDSVGRYQDTQLEKSHDEGWLADKNATVSIAAADPRQVDTTVREIDRLNRYQAARKGWEGPTLEQENLKDTTTLHINVLKGLADTNPSAARDYLAKYGKQIDGRSMDGIDRVLKVGETKQAGFAFVERTLGGGKGVPTFDWSAPDAYAQARTAARDFFKDDPDKRDAALREINTREAEAIQSRERAQRTAADSAWGIYGRTGNLNDVPAGVLASMDGKDFAAIKEAAANKAAGKGTVTDFATYYDLRQQALNDPEGFRKTDLRRYIGKLAPSDLEEMAKLQTAKPSEIKDAATLGQQLGNMHDLLMWGSNDKEKKEKKGAFDRAATDAIQTEARRRGKELTYEERQAVIDRMVLSGEVVSGHWYQADANRRYYEVAGTEDAAKFAPDIPDTEKAKIKAALTRAGRPVTDDEVMRLFKQKHGIK